VTSSTIDRSAMLKYFIFELDWINMCFVVTVMTFLIDLPVPVPRYLLSLYDTQGQTRIIHADCQFHQFKTSCTFLSIPTYTLFALKNQCSLTYVRTPSASHQVHAPSKMMKMHS
jgi:hypothetical protein